MRRTSLTPDQAEQLAVIFRKRRSELGLSLRQVAARAGVNVGTVFAVEAATNLSPLPETLKALANALDLRVSDLYAVADWLPAGDLPTLAPYMRAKYHDLSDADIAATEAFIDKLRAKHDLTGPTNSEDEIP